LPKTENLRASRPAESGDQRAVVRSAAHISEGITPMKKLLLLLVLIGAVAAAASALRSD
jgi:hypothetical protein